MEREVGEMRKSGKNEKLKEENEKCKGEKD